MCLIDALTVILIASGIRFLNKNTEKYYREKAQEAGIDPKDIEKTEEWISNAKKAYAEEVADQRYRSTIASEATYLSRYLDDIKIRYSSRDPALEQKLKGYGFRDFVFSARSLHIPDQYTKVALKKFCSDNEVSTAFEDAKGKNHSCVYYFYTDYYKSLNEKTPYDE